MSYTLKSLIEQFIAIERNGFSFYTELASLKNMPHRVRTMAKVFAMEELRHIKIYENIREDQSIHLYDDVDEGIYKKALQMIDDFLPHKEKLKSYDRKGLLELSLNMERENLVLIEILKDLLNKAEEKSSGISDFLDSIAKEEHKHIANIQSLLT